MIVNTSSGVGSPHGILIFVTERWHLNVPPRAMEDLVDDAGVHRIAKLVGSGISMACQDRYALMLVFYSCHAFSPFPGFSVILISSSSGS
jgi:hypothetical protein